MRILKLNLLLVLITLLALNACKKDEAVTPATDLSANEWVYEVMKFYYLWNDQLPKPFNPYEYASPEAVLEALRFSGDRFSFITPEGQALINQLTQGQINGAFGFSMRYDTQDTLRVAFVYKNTPAANAGLKRGVAILKVNDDSNFLKDKKFPGFSQTSTITFKDLDGQIKTSTMTATNITINTVVFGKIETINTSKVGYMVFNSFFASSAKELDSTFAVFKAEGVTDLVLDLRYNGGGSVAVAQQLASLLAPENAIGKVFLKEKFNENNADLDTILNFKSEANRLNLKKLVVITSEGTASASELIINSLKPFLKEDIQTVGGTTAGKNVGSFVFTYQNYAFLPIVFKSENAEGFSDFGNGFVPNYPALDDVSRPFGDPTESSYAAALYYIQNGTFPPQRPGKNRPTVNSPLQRLDGSPGVLPVLDLRTIIISNS